MSISYLILEILNILYSWSAAYISIQSIPFEISAWTRGIHDQWSLFMCILLVHVKRHESHKYPLFGLLKVTQQFKFVLSSGLWEYMRM